MILEKYIRELLFREDCVTIPGLGGFISNYVPAEIREESQTFIPPTKEIGFNTELNKDDGLLVSYMSGMLDRPESVIREMIASQVGEILATISRGGEIKLEEIGYFSSGKDGKLIFKADLGVNFLLDSFGLSPFTFPILESEKLGFLRRSIIFRRPNYHGMETLPGSVRKSTGKNKTTQQVAIALTVFVFLSLLPYNSRISESIFRHPASLGPLPSLILLDPPVELQKMTTNTVIYQPEIVSSDVSDESAAMIYPIIAGSFQSGQNAEILRQKLISKGYKAKVERARKSFYRVIITEFLSLTEAELALPGLQAGNRDLNLWILK